MARDVNGTPIAEGDIVAVFFTVKTIYESEPNRNLLLEPVEPDASGYKTTIFVNSKQVDLGEVDENQRYALVGGT